LGCKIKDWKTQEFYMKIVWIEGISKNCIPVESFWRLLFGLKERHILSKGKDSYTIQNTRKKPSSRTQGKSSLAWSLVHHTKLNTYGERERSGKDR
jgi:hypothetical protein